MHMHTALFTMTNSIQKTNQETGLEPDSQGFINRQLNIKNVQPRIEYDPVKEQEEKFTKLNQINEQIKVLLDVKEKLKDSFKPALLSLEEEYEDTGEEVIIRSENTKAKVSLRRLITYVHTEAVTKKEERLKNLKADIKASKDKEIRLNKATVKAQKVSVVFTG